AHSAASSLARRYSASASRGAALDSGALGITGRDAGRATSLYSARRRFDLVPAASCALSAAFSARSASWLRPSSGRELTVVVCATASEYFRYVSIEATTTLASPVMRSITT